jgi:hypothetical protein
MNFIFSGTSWDVTFFSRFAVDHRVSCSWEHWWVFTGLFAQSSEKNTIVKTLEVLDFSSTQCPQSSSWVYKELGKHGYCIGNTWSCPCSKLDQTSKSCW